MRQLIVSIGIFVGLKAKTDIQHLSIRKLEPALGAENRRSTAEEYTILGAPNCLIVEVGPLPVVATEQLQHRSFNQDLARPAVPIEALSGTTNKSGAGQRRGGGDEQRHTLQACCRKTPQA